MLRRRVSAVPPTPNHQSERNLLSRGHLTSTSQSWTWSRLWSPVSPLFLPSPVSPVSLVPLSCLPSVPCLSGVSPVPPVPPASPQRPYLGLSLLQQRLQSLLGRSSLVVVADDQNDVVPAELSHQVEPDLGLVGVRWDGPQEGQVDALQDRRTHTGQGSNLRLLRGRRELTLSE